MAGTVAIVLGGALTVWSELELALSWSPDATIVATNHAGRDFDGPLPHWVTMHPELLRKWIDERAAAGRPPAGHLWTCENRPTDLKINRIKNVGGSSGMLATMVALTMADRVMLCGVPINQNGKHYDKPDMPWSEARQYLAAWEKQLPVLLGRVKSFGGDTAKLLGCPSRSWLDEAGEVQPLPRP